MTPVDRRSFLLASVAAAALPGLSVAQAGRDVAFAARLRALTGFDPLPEPLVAGLTRAAREAGLVDVVLDETGPPGPAHRRLLRAAYSGIWEPPGEDAGPERLVFADALKWAAISETNNVISWCGGVPGFWADPPVTSAPSGRAAPPGGPDGFRAPPPRTMGG